MTAPSSIDPAYFLHEQLAQASPDLLRPMLTTFIGTLMSAEADAVCGAEYGARSAEPANTRNGNRHREFDSRARLRRRHRSAGPRARQRHHDAEHLQPPLAHRGGPHEARRRGTLRGQLRTGCGLDHLNDPPTWVMSPPTR